MPSLTTSEENSSFPQLNIPIGSNFGVTEESSSSFFIIVVIIIVAILLLILVMSVVKWFIRERRLRELRHRLIPLYSFDPNDEDDWDTEFLNQDQSIVSQVSQDYNSVSTTEDNIDSSMSKQRLNLV